MQMQGPPNMTLTELGIHAKGLRAYADAVLAAMAEATAVQTAPAVDVTHRAPAPDADNGKSAGQTAQVAQTSTTLATEMQPVVETTETTETTEVIAVPAVPAPAAPVPPAVPVAAPTAPVSAGTVKRAIPDIDISGNVVAQIGAMERPILIRYIEERPHLLSHQAFHRFGGSLDGKQARVIRTALAEALAANGTTQGIRNDAAAPSRQVPDVEPAVVTVPEPAKVATAAVPTRPTLVRTPPRPVLPTNDITDKNWDWGTEGTNMPPFAPEDVHPDLRSDDAALTSANELMQTVQSWRALDAAEGVQPPHTENFFRKKQCAGVCVLHPISQVRKCIADLSDA